MNIPQIQELPGGWFQEEDIAVYRQLVDSIPAGGTILELGSWKGRSICSLADLLIAKDIKVYIVDTFQGTESEGDAHQEAKEIDLYQECRNSLYRFNILDRVTIIQSLTDDAVKDLQSERFDLIFIDADHQTESVVKDIINYRPLLKENGILSGHDWTWPSVREALAITGIEPTANKNMWYVGKLKNPKFSICFIGRNEAKTLPRALESIKEFRDRGGEVCYLDTGSTDGTADIARSYGCKVEEVGDMFVSYISQEESDAINGRFVVDGESRVVNPGDRLFRFDAARNYCAEHLATNDMISWFDCDEIMTKMDIDKIESLIAEGYTQFEYNFVFAHGPHGEEFVKFVQSKFYNRKSQHWDGIVHEIITGPGNRLFLTEDIFKLEHYQNEETNRSGYLKGLALDCWKRQEQDRQSHYFARELLWTGRPKSAIKEFERHLSISWWNAERAESMIFIARAYLMLGDEAKAVEWFHKAYVEDPGRREALLSLAELYYKKSEWLRVASYCQAALVIPWSGYYATHKPYYENVPHELLAEAYWFMGDHAKSKEHYSKALEFSPLSSKLLHDYRFHFALPKVSILLPTLNRPEGLQRCLKSIENLNYPKDLIEVVWEEDEPRLGVPKRVDKLFKQSTGEYVVFAADDTEFTPDSIMIAFLDMQKESKGLCAFNTGPVTPDEGNICLHFIMKRELVELIGGEIFCNRMNHVGVDNLLWAKCKKLNEAMRSEHAVVQHHHFSTEGTSFDSTYEKAWSDVDNDRKILAEELAKL